MLSTPVAALVVLAGSLLCWPRVRVVHRVRDGRSKLPRGTLPWRPRGTSLVLIPAAGVLGAVVAGVGGCCAGVALAGLGRWYWRTRRELRRSLEHTADFANGVRLFVTELRAGAHPATAAAGVAAEAVTGVAEVFGELAAAGRLGGDVSTVLSDSDRVSVQLRAPVGRFARSWELAERHGIALAELLDAVRRDLEHRVAFIRDVESKMAGPRATAAVLAGLPVLGLLLGQAVGAAPLAVLTGGSFGQVLLVVGVGLLCGGLVWTVRLTGAVVR